MTRRGVIALVLLAAGLGAGGARAATVVVVSGRGWGHGVGMSQWGARGYALHGWSWRQILGHYYPGTQVGATPNVTVRVLLAASQRSVDIACPAPMKVGDATGRYVSLPARTYHLTARLRIRKLALQSPLAFYCAGAPLEWNGRAYHGRLVVSSGEGLLAVVNSLDLEDYVRGVIADEMPFHWPLAALEAQAVAARSYALATVHPTRRFDLYADDRSQMYGGIGAETPQTLFAATQTERRILTWNGNVATTYFFSTSGGRTADVRDVWPKLGAIPYLRSVADPYDAASPVHLWGPFSLSPGLLSARLGVPFGPVRVVRDTSGRVATLEVGTASLPGDLVQRRLHLRSTWFSVGELDLDVDRSLVSFGRSVSLLAHASGLGPALVQRWTGTRWVTLRRIAAGARITVSPWADSIYRLTADGVRGPEVAVSVAPHIWVRPSSSVLLDGRVVPRPTGAVTVWRDVGGTWRVVARPELNAHGVFRAPLRLRAGGYRISVAGDGHLAPATATMRLSTRLLAGLHR